MQPGNTKNVSACEAVEQILEAFIHIEPRALAQVIDHYFEILSKAYTDGNTTIAQYLGYVYSEIIATGRDPFGLKDIEYRAHTLDSCRFQRLVRRKNM